MDDDDEYYAQVAQVAWTYSTGGHGWRDVGIAVRKAMARVTPPTPPTYANIIPAEQTNLCDIAIKAGVQVMVRESGDGRWTAFFEPPLLEESSYGYGYGNKKPICSQSSVDAAGALQNLAIRCSSNVLYKRTSLWGYEVYDFTYTKVVP
jgi:hypothetical protein